MKFCQHPSGQCQLTAPCREQCALRIDPFNCPECQAHDFGFNRPQCPYCGYDESDLAGNRYVDSVSTDGIKATAEER